MSQSFCPFCLAPPTTTADLVDWWDRSCLKLKDPRDDWYLIRETKGAGQGCSVHSTIHEEPVELVGKYKYLFKMFDHRLKLDLKMDVEVFWENWSPLGWVNTSLGPSITLTIRTSSPSTSWFHFTLGQEPAVWCGKALLKDYRAFLWDPSVPSITKGPKGRSPQ